MYILATVLSLCLEYVRCMVYGNEHVHGPDMYKKNAALGYFSQQKAESEACRTCYSVYNSRDARECFRQDFRSERFLARGWGIDIESSFNL